MKTGRRAFHVGVVGHRPNRLVKEKEPELCAALRDVLARVKAAVEAAWSAGDSAAKVVLRAVSPLAEGTDRLFARQALDLGYALCCIMPFAQAEFEKDFAPDKAHEPGALSGFHALLERASRDPDFVRCELAGQRSHALASYGAAGAAVLQRSDLMMVVWDGVRTGKRGGTEETFGQAVARGVPCVWIDAHNPCVWQVVNAERRLPKRESGERATPRPAQDRDELDRVVAQLLARPRLAAEG